MAIQTVQTPFSKVSAVLGIVIMGIQHQFKNKRGSLNSPIHIEVEADKG
jgi:type IV secretory pathway VirB2 component (pilin)